MKAASSRPMERGKSAEADVRASEQGSGNAVRNGIKVLVCGSSGERMAQMTRFLAAFEYEAVTARSAETALRAARGHEPQIAIWLETDVTARRGVLLDAARQLRQDVPAAESITIGPADDHNYSAAAFRAGVYNCMSWPVDYARLGRDLEFLSLEAQRRRELWMWEAGEREVRFEGLVGGSPRMLALYAQLRLAAVNQEPVLITGPVGSGKELSASALHALMEKNAPGQAHHPLLVYRCCGLTEKRAGELFVPRGVLGPVSGDRGINAASPSEAGGIADLLGFTRPGMILLDEISDLPPAAQQRLAAWMLVNRAVRKEFPVRVAASTRCDLAALAQQGKFHAGLFRLLQGQTVAVPSLAERREDIPMLVEHFIGRYVKEQTGVEQLAPAPQLSRDAQRALLGHGWPGNVRELGNAVSRAAMLARSGRIDAGDLGLQPPARPSAHVLDWHEAARPVWLN